MTDKDQEKYIAPLLKLLKGRRKTTLLIRLRFWIKNVRKLPSRYGEVSVSWSLEATHQEGETRKVLIENNQAVWGDRFDISFTLAQSGDTFQPVALNLSLKSYAIQHKRTLGKDVASNRQYNKKKELSTIRLNLVKYASAFSLISKQFPLHSAEGKRKLSMQLDFHARILKIGDRAIVRASPGKKYSVKEQFTFDGEQYVMIDDQQSSEEEQTIELNNDQISMSEDSKATISMGVLPLPARALSIEDAFQSIHLEQKLKPSVINFFDDVEEEVMHSPEEIVLENTVAIESSLPELDSKVSNESKSSSGSGNNLRTDVLLKKVEDADNEINSKQKQIDLQLAEINNLKSQLRDVIKSNLRTRKNEKNSKLTEHRLESLKKQLETAQKDVTDKQALVSLQKQEIDLLKESLAKTPGKKTILVAMN